MRRPARIFDGAVLATITLAALLFCYECKVFPKDARPHSVELDEWALVSIIFCGGLLICALRSFADQQASRVSISGRESFALGNGFEACNLVPRYFLVTSQGVSATRWIAFALASHPRVFVAHGHFPIDSVVSGKFAGEDDTGSLSSGNKGRAFYETKDLNGIFAAYRSACPGVEAYGSVHSFTLSNVQKLMRNSTKMLRPTTVNVVRHPVSFIDGHSALVRKAEAYPDIYKNYESYLFPRALAEFSGLFLADCPDFREFIAFVVSCSSALIVARELGDKRFDHYQMESLTSDGRALAAFCKKLTGLDYPRELLDARIAAGTINRHRSALASSDEQEIYGGWAQWKRDIVAIMMSEEALARFEGVGYDVGMLRARGSETDLEHTPARSLADRLRDTDKNHPLLRILRRRTFA